LNLAALIENDSIKFVIELAGVFGFCVVVVQVAIGFGQRGRRGFRQSKEHFEQVIAESLGDQRYLSACILILLTRMVASLSLVLVSTAFLAVTLFANAQDGSPGADRSSAIGITGSAMDYVIILFFILSWVLFIGNVISAANFSRAVRRGINEQSVRSPVASDLLGFGE
jgi:hypothetical protein